MRIFQNNWIKFTYMLSMNMKVRTVRQVKQQRPRNKKPGVAVTDINNAVCKPSTNVQKIITPPTYRMPPQPQPGSTNIYSDAPIPGATIVQENTSQQQNGMSNITLRTHSSKFPIERELILSSDKNASKIPLMHDSRSQPGIRRNVGLQILPRPQGGAIAPDHPPSKQTQAWNTQAQCPPLQSQQQQQQEIQMNQSSMSGAIPRAPARLPEDVTALAERENGKDRDLKDTNKNAVAKTYHTLKDLISSKFKKENNESLDGLNNVLVQQQQLQSQQVDEYRSPYSALPAHMRQNQSLNQSQPNIWMGPPQPQQQQQQQQQQPQQPQPRAQQFVGGPIGQQRNYTPEPQQRTVMTAQQRATSQPQLNMNFDRRVITPQIEGQQQLMMNQSQQQVERRGSLANIDVTDSDDGGFISKGRRPQTMYHIPPPQQQQQQPQQAQIPQNMNHRHSPQVFQNASTPGQATIQQIHDMSAQQVQYNGAYQQHPQYMTNGQQQYQQQTYQQPHFQNQPIQNQPNLYSSQKLLQESTMQQGSTSMIQTRQDQLRASFQKLDNPQQHMQHGPLPQMHENHKPQPPARPDRPASANDLLKPVPGSAASSDYDKSGNHSSNVDSGRGSAAYSSGRKGGAQLDTSPESSDSVLRPKDNDADWVDIVDAELRNILEPQMQDLSIRPESTVSGSVSSMSPPLPPISPSGSGRYKSSHSKDHLNKQEYGTDSYNRPGKGPIGPSRAGWPGSSIQKQGVSGRTTSKKQEQSLLKRHLFGLDNDLTSTTTRSLDLDSLLGTPWGGGQSVSDSETDTQGLRHIRNQLEGLEHMYSEVLKMLGGNRNPPSRLGEGQFLNGRRRHGSLSSLPSSSVSGRPVRDRRRIEGRRKVRDIKGINKRFQRLESHVVTLARSVAHLSSEMRSQHLVTQELERLRDDFAALRAQSTGGRATMSMGNLKSMPEPPNLTNPRRVKKLTKFFGEDPPLMRLFLKNLGYEKYATLFEAERVGMIELPYLGEERLQKLGVPLGPRLRILQEAQISLCKDTTLCIV